MLTHWGYGDESTFSNVREILRGFVRGRPVRNGNTDPRAKVQAIAYENRIELIPQRPMMTMRGFLKGIDTDVPREDDRV